MGFLLHLYVIAESASPLRERYLEAVADFVERRASVSGAPKALIFSERLTNFCHPRPLSSPLTSEWEL